MKRILMFTLAALAVAATAWWICPRPTQHCDLRGYTNLSRDAKRIPDDLSGEKIERIVYLDQGWTPGESMEFYTRTQGSRLLPYSWFLALEQAENEKLFRDNDNLNRLRYLPLQPNDCNPDGLPIGFVRDPKRPGGKEDWLGLNCAACHTNQIIYDNIAYRIDGGPGMGDQESLLREITLALKKTLEDPRKFDRFAAVVAKRAEVNVDKADLRKQVEQVYEFRRNFDQRNSSPHPAGFGRLDAFGRILNEVMVTAAKVDNPEQAKPNDAPVSYPFLWDTPHHDFVQWNGIAANKMVGSSTLGALTRNSGEVVGVFGEVEIPEEGEGGGLKGYNSSVRVGDLIAIEEVVRKLQSPQWPKEFPPIDPLKRDAGALLFNRYCLHCHANIDRADPNRSVTANLTSIERLGTDPRMAENFASRRGATGRLKDRRSRFLVGEKFGAEASGDSMLVHVVLGIILNSPQNDYKESELLQVRRRAASVIGTQLVYKGRPLNGIWATAPYLHNGSVPNLYQLLLPGEERSVEFQLGRRIFDPKHVGFETASSPGSYQFRVKDNQGNLIPGNSNLGHEYGTGKPVSLGGDGLRKLDEAERQQLLEYLKSL